MRNTIIASVVALIIGLAGGLYLGRGQVKTETVEKVVYKEGEVKVVTVDRTIIREKIVAPDGTVTEREIQKDISADTTSKTKEVNTDRTITSTPVLAQYSLGLHYTSPYREVLQYSDVSKYSAIAGRRIVGPAWLEVGAGLKEVTLGVRVEL